MASFFAAPSATSVPLYLVDQDSWSKLRTELSAEAVSFAEASGFKASANQHVLLPGKTGLSAVLFAPRREEHGGETGLARQKHMLIGRGLKSRSLGETHRLGA